jgi:hypothetical protein
LKSLLKACWQDNENDRPTMEKVIEMIDEIPTINPDYVMVGAAAPKKHTYHSNIEKLKKILSSNLNFNAIFSSSEKAPPRKISKPVNKMDIGYPQEFRKMLSIGVGQNGDLSIHDHEEDRRRRHVSGSNNNGGTLPREANKKIGPAISTPELNHIGCEPTLQRKQAIKKRKPGTHCHENPIKPCKPAVLGSTTPSSEASISFDTIEIVEDPGLFTFFKLMS